MRLVSDVNWENWFDDVSLVDKEMRDRSDFGAMDFPSRTLYRNAVEELARGSDQSELDVARSALTAAADPANPRDSVLADPGYFLIGPGRANFETGFGFKAPVLRRARVFVKSAGLGGYLGSILLVTAVLLLVLCSVRRWPRVHCCHASHSAGAFSGAGRCLKRHSRW